MSYIIILYFFMLVQVPKKKEKKKRFGVSRGSFFISYCVYDPVKIFCPFFTKHGPGTRKVNVVSFAFIPSIHQILRSQCSVRGYFLWPGLWMGGGAEAQQISPRPISPLIWPYRGNNELLRCCFSSTPDLSPPPKPYSDIVCFAFTYTYDLKESLRSGISPQPHYFKTPIGPFRISGASWGASLGLKQLRSLSSRELEVAQSVIWDIVPPSLLVYT